MNIFYTPNISDKTYVLEEQESKHCIRVLRRSKGDQLILVDGIGGWYEAVIVDPNPKKCVVHVSQSEQDYEKRKYRLHLAVAPTKNIDRFEWLLEKATEIGIDEITPITCEHSERRQINYDRLEKVLIAAMKQSLKAFLPKLNNLTTFESLIKNANTGVRLIAHCEEGIKPYLFNVVEPKQEVLVLIGPEGDFSIDEIQMAITNGFQEISLGRSRLRTETAGVVATQIINLVNEK